MTNKGIELRAFLNIANRHNCCLKSLCCWFR